MPGGRDLHASTAAALDAEAVYTAWLFRLDIADDPVIVWTGARDYTPAGTGDAALDGFLFERVGFPGNIGNVVDGRGGSQALSLSLPGVDLNDEALKQVVKDKRRWQFRQAWVWIATLDANYNVVGVPFRVKTGRIDKMNIGQGRKGNYVNVTIESHQAYASEVANTKYSELRDFDPTDTSQNYVHDLANRQAIIGGATANNASTNALVRLSDAVRGGRSTNPLIERLRSLG